jgi:F0F1-type ATP synthase delta subunit
MKYRINDYAKALVGAIEAKPAGGDAAIEKNFLALVRKNGDEARLGKILDEAGRLTRAKKGGTRAVLIESARSLSAAQEKMVKHFLHPGDAVQYCVNKDLIAGIRITVNDEAQFDGTMEKKLNSVFGGII